MAEAPREEAAVSKYKDGEKLWSGKSFTQYLLNKRNHPARRDIRYVFLLEF